MERLSPAALHRALRETPPAWSQPSSYQVTEVHHGYRQAGIVWDSSLQLLLRDYRPVAGSWLSHLDPGGFIAPHRDAGPYRERWQIPIHAAGEFVYTDTGERFTPRDGDPFRVEHWRPHAVVNTTDRPRIHIVVDRDAPVDVEPRRFETFEPSDDIADMIARLNHGA